MQLDIKGGIMGKSAPGRKASAAPPPLAAKSGLRALSRGSALKPEVFAAALGRGCLSPPRCSRSEAQPFKLLLVHAAGLYLAKVFPFFGASSEHLSKITCAPNVREIVHDASPP